MNLMLTKEQSQELAKKREYNRRVAVLTREFEQLKRIYFRELHGFKLGFNNRKTQLGVCFYTERKIELSRLHIEATNLEQMLDTVRHEVAHAYSYYHHGRDGTGHGENFKAACKIVGAIPKTCATVSQDEKKILPKYVSVCKIHGKRGEYHKRALLSCSACSKKFDRRYLLDFVPYADYIKSQGETK